MPESFNSTTISGKLTINEPTSTVASNGDGTILINHLTSGGSSSIVFKSTINSGSDYGFIQFDDNRGSGGENNKFTIGTQNDFDDDLYLSPSGKTYITTDLIVTTGSGSGATGALSAGSLTAGTISTSNGSINTGTLGATSIAIAGSLTCPLYNGTVKAGTGYLSKQGTSGGYSNVWNLFWNGTNMEIWVDNVNVGTICDYRIKENINETKSVLERLCNINMFDFTHKNIGIFKNNGNHLGIYAHELQESFPEYPCLVIGKKDEKNDNGDIKAQTIRIDNLTLIMMKAIQEQNNEINQLKDNIKDLNINITELKNSIKEIKQFLNI